MKSSFVFYAIAFLLCATFTQAVPLLSGPVYNPANGHYYYLLDASTWMDAENQAKAFGGHLVTINNSAEDSFVFNNFKSLGGVNRNLWIGFNDLQSEGSWVWASGEAVTYTHWYSGEPNNYNEEDCGMFFPAGDTYGRDGTWNDAQGAAFLYGVIELNYPVPEPSSFVVCTLALGLGFLWNKRGKLLNFL